MISNYWSLFVKDIRSFVRLLSLPDDFKLLKRGGHERQHRTWMDADTFRHIIHDIYLLIGYIFKTVFHFILMLSTGYSANKLTSWTRRLRPSSGQNDEIILTGKLPLKTMDPKRHSLKCRIKPGGNIQKFQRTNIRHYSESSMRNAALFDNAAIPDDNNVIQPAVKLESSVNSNYDYLKDEEDFGNHTALTEPWAKLDDENNDKMLIRKIDSNIRHVLDITASILSKRDSERTARDKLTLNETYKQLLLIRHRVRLDKIYRWIWKLSVFIILTWLCYGQLWPKSTFLRKITFSGLRRAEIMMLPIWDWRPLYYRSCLIYNPNYDITKEEALTVDDCQVCLDTKRIAVFTIENVTEPAVVNKLKGDEPFLVVDGASGWPVFDPESKFRMFSLKDLDNFYYDHENLEFSYPCSLHTNYKKKYAASSRAKRNDILSGTADTHDKIYGYWENCEKWAAKTFRKLYKRPSFLPGMAESITTNWVFISRNYRALNYLEVPITSTSVWWAQILGKTEIRLVPRIPCNRYCQELTIQETMPQNIIIWNDKLWEAHYKPIGKANRKLDSVDMPGKENDTKMSETFAIASGFYWNHP